MKGKKNPKNEDGKRQRLGEGQVGVDVKLGGEQCLGFPTDVEPNQCEFVRNRTEKCSSLKIGNRVRFCNNTTHLCSSIILQV